MGKSNFIVRHIDPKHEPALDYLRNKYGTRAISTALSCLLDDIMGIHERAAIVEARERRLVVLLAQIAEQNKRKADADRQINRAMKDATAIAKEVADQPRQFSIADGYE
jgi:hypothetical protein